jgi:hypothetical protein
MVTVCRKMEAIRRCGQCAAEKMLVTHNWVRNDHSSGKARLPIVLLK